MNKAYFYEVMQKLHLIRPKLKYNTQHDLPLYCKTYRQAPDKAAAVFFDNILALMQDLHVYEIDANAHQMILDTMIDEIPLNHPELLQHPFLLNSVKPIISGYSLVSYSPHIEDNYLMQSGSEDMSLPSVAMQGRIADIGHPTTFNVTNLLKTQQQNLPKETPEEIKNAIFKYIFTFSILLEAEKTPLEIMGKPMKLKNHFAKKAGVSKNLWSTRYIYLNANVKRMYDEHTEMDKSGKVQIPGITRAHIRNVHINGIVKQVFIPSYVSNKWHSKKLHKSKVSTIEGV